MDVRIFKARRNNYGAMMNEMNETGIDQESWMFESSKQERIMVR
jgi:hypothetical protein